MKHKPVTFEVADVFRRFGDGYLAEHGAAMPPSHRCAIGDLQACRTPALGGHQYRCEHCGEEVHAWHSCKNRSCPKCHTTQTREWLEKRHAQMLPISYFHVTVTTPQPLRAIFRSNQRDCYGLLQQASGEAIMELARDERYCGGTVGILEVLHTWTQMLHYHPHVHCLVTGGGISADGLTWLPVVRPEFLFPVRALSRLVRGKFLTLLKHKRPDLSVPEAAWTQEWVVHCAHWKAGETGVLDYLARYVFRVALANCRILALDEQTVTFRYTDRESGQRLHCQVTGHEFIRRFLQHVLPKGFHKVRYFGLWHSSKREVLDRVRLALLLESRKAAPVDLLTPVAAPDPEEDDKKSVYDGTACPACRQGRLRHVQEVPPTMTRGP